MKIASPYSIISRIPSRKEINEAKNESLNEIRNLMETQSPSELIRLKDKYERLEIISDECEEVRVQKLNELNAVYDGDYIPDSSDSIIRMFNEGIDSEFSEDYDYDDDEPIHERHFSPVVEKAKSEYDKAYNDAQKAKLKAYEARNEYFEMLENVNAFTSESDRIFGACDIAIRFRMKTVADAMSEERRVNETKSSLEYSRISEEIGRHLSDKKNYEEKANKAHLLAYEWKTKMSSEALVGKTSDEISCMLELFKHDAMELDPDFNHLFKINYEKKTPSKKIVSELFIAEKGLRRCEDKIYNLLNIPSTSYTKACNDREFTEAEIERAENSEFISSEAVLPALRAHLASVIKKIDVHKEALRRNITREFRFRSRFEDAEKILRGIYESQKKACERDNLESIISIVNDAYAYRYYMEIYEEDFMARASSSECKASALEASINEAKKKLSEESDLVKESKELASDAAKYAPKLAFWIGAKVNADIPSAALQMAHDVASRVCEKLGIEVCDVSVAYNLEAAFKERRGFPPRPEISLAAARAAAKTTAKNSVKKQGTPTQWNIYFAAQSGAFCEVPASYDNTRRCRIDESVPEGNDTGNVNYRWVNHDLHDMISAASDIPCLFGLSTKDLMVEKKKAKTLLNKASDMKRIANRDTIAKEIVISALEKELAALDADKAPILREIERYEKAFADANEEDDLALYELDQAENPIGYDDIIMMARLSDAIDRSEYARKSQNEIGKKLTELKGMIRDIRLSDDPNKVISRASSEMLVYDAIDNLIIAEHEYARARELADNGDMTVEPVINALRDALIDAKANVPYMATRAMYRSINNYLGDNRGIRESASIPVLSLDDISEVIADPRFLGYDAVSEFTARRREIMRDTINIAVPNLTPRQKSVLKVLYRTNGCIKESARKLQISPNAVRGHLANISMVFASAAIKAAPDSFERELLGIAAIANELDVIQDKSGDAKVDAAKNLFNAAAKVRDAEEREARSKEAHKAEDNMRKAQNDNYVAQMVESAIADAVAKFTPAIREPVKLVAKGMSKREAARVLGKSEGAVRLAIKEACRKISEAIGCAVPELKESAKAMADAVKINELIGLAIKK